ncbi:glycoside hydrolase family 88/105 protein [Dysgonomonas reticulitermitis]
MKKPFLFLLLIVFSLITHGQDLKSWPEGKDPKTIGLLVANRFVASPHNSFRPPAPPNSITYPETCAWYGALKFGEVTQNKTLLVQLEQRFQPFFSEEKHLVPKPVHVDATVFGSIPFELYMLTKNKKYLDLGLYFADGQWTMPENAAADKKQIYKELLDKNLTWHTRYWIDDMYMITMVQSQAYRATKDRKYIDRAAHEMVVYLDTIQKPNGLFYHSPDAPFFWGRGNGWMAAGMSELLSSVPKDNKDRPAIMASYLKMMKSLKEYQRADGLWGQLIDKPESWVETSGSAMFTYAMIVGVKNGWLDKKEYTPVARKAWIALIDYINEDGDISNVCEGTNRKNDYQYYLDRKRKTGDMHGQAPIMWCAAALLQ